MINETLFLIRFVIVYKPVFLITYKVLFVFQWKIIKIRFHEKIKFLFILTRTEILVKKNIFHKFLIITSVKKYKT